MHLTSDQGYISGDLNASREAVMMDLAYISVVPYQEFKKWLPPIKGDLQRALATLREQGVLLSSNGWRDWQTTAAHSQELKDKTFEPFEALVNSIISAAGDENALVELVHNPRKAPISARNNDSKPDGHFLLRRGQSPPSKTGQTRLGLRPYEALVTRNPLAYDPNDPAWWEDVAVPLEYKNKATPADKQDVSAPRPTASAILLKSCKLE